MTDPIPPPLATRPDQACALLCDALSDGDLDAALAQYHPTAAVSPEPGRTVRGRAGIRRLLADAADARTLFTVQVRQSLVAEDLALVCGHWTRGPAAPPGHYCSVVRRRPDGRWEIAIEAITPADSTHDTA